MNKSDKISESNPFRIPENYFEDVKRKIITATAESNLMSKNKGIYPTLRPFLLTAASVAILCILSYTGLKLFNTGNGKLSQSLITEEIYSESPFKDIDLSTLEDEALGIGFPASEQKADKNEIIDYLVFENIDIDEIHEQL